MSTSLPKNQVKRENAVFTEAFWQDIVEIMTLYEYHIVFPEGETQEIDHQLGAGDLIDINGNTIPLPLPTNRMIAYHIARKRTQEERGVITTLYYLEQLNAMELLGYT
jgi:hypothetical protein